MVERFAKLTDDIEAKRHKFEQTTGFDAVRKTQPPVNITLRQPLIGMLLEIFSAANGDMSKAKVQFKEKKPLIRIALNGGVTVEGVDKQIEALDAYLDELCDCLEEKLPRLLDEMTLLLDRVTLL